jgi:DNA-binding protein
MESHVFSTINMSASELQVSQALVRAVGISRAAQLLAKNGEVTLSAINTAISTAVTIAEFLKHRVKNLYQENKFEKVEGSNKTRVTILLSQKPLKTDGKGYQHPVPESEVIEKSLEELAKLPWVDAEWKPRETVTGNETGQSRPYTRRGRGRGRRGNRRGRGEGFVGRSEETKGEEYLTTKPDEVKGSSTEKQEEQHETREFQSRRSDRSRRGWGRGRQGARRPRRPRGRQDGETHQENDERDFGDRGARRNRRHFRRPRGRTGGEGQTRTAE